MNGQYYTLQEVMKILKKSRSTVLREAKTGEIPSEIEEGKAKGRRYPKVAIDALAEIRWGKEKEKKEPRYVFSPSTPNDLWAEVTIGRDLYGDDDIVPYKQLLEWREANNEIYMSLNENGRVIAYSSLMPLDKDIILLLLEDKIRERDTPITTIRQWTDPQISVYIASITVKPSGDLYKDKERGRILLRETVKWALSLDRQADINNWYGIGATRQGQNLFERLGFTEITSLYNGERKGYHLRDVKKPVKLINQLLKEMSSPDSE